MRMARKSLNLLVEEELVLKARDHGLVISRFVENKLQEYFTFIDAVSKAQSPSKSEIWARRDLNSRPPPCQGDVITN